MKRIVVATILLFLVSCDNENTLEPTHDVTGLDQTIRVTTYSSETELNRAVRKLEEAPDYDVEGLAQWRMDTIGNVKRCDIHVVEPKSRTDRDQMETWGHELMHCIYGSYHKEGER